MAEPLRVLIIDDSERDALLVARALEKGGYAVNWERFDSPADLSQALQRGGWELALCDCHMPVLSVEEALELWRAFGLDRPFIIVSGAVGEEEAVHLLKAGAHDFIRKDNTARLVPAIARELREAEERRERRRVQKELRESEEKYRLLFSSDSNAILLMDSETRRVVEVNPAAERLFGYGPAAFSGLSVDDLAVKDDADSRGIVPESPGMAQVTLLRKENGGTFPGEISSGPFAWQGRPMQVLIIRDVTERYKIEMMKDEMLSAVSHEMRTPLTALLGYMEFMLSNDVAADRQRDLHQIVYREASRLKHLIDNLLNLQRLRARDGAGNFQPLEVRLLLQQTAESFQGGGTSHKVVLACPPGLPMVSGDDRLLRLALENLVTNAIKFTPAGGTVSLEARREDGYVILGVRDQGPGIPQPELDSMFDHFFRLTTKDDGRRIGASGLGLPLVKEIALSHGGRAWADSDPGQGSVFCFSIPITDT